MTSPVLVGLDASGLDSSALVWAVEWCLHSGSELLVVSAFEPGQAEMSPGWHDEKVEQAHQSVEARIGKVEGRSPLKHRSRVLDGDITQAIMATAVEEAASLVVVGARGSGGFHDLGLGGVAHHLAHHVRRPLVIVPEPGGRIAGGTIVVGVDGSDGSATALAWAVKAARSVGGSVNAVFAYDPISDSFPHMNVPSSQPQGEGEGEAEIQAQVDKLDTHGVVVTTTLVGNHPVAALTEVGADVDACLIVAGTRGSGGFHGLLLGRVPAQLPHHAGRPVALIHHDSD